MAERRPEIPIRMKRVLIEQCGGKCANPGCPNCLTEFHHIKEWAVYQTHDVAHMIAICPACHDQVTRGQLRISDDELYAWKGIKRTSSLFTGSIFVEPNPIPSILLGSVCFAGADGVTIFEFATQRLGLTTRDMDLAILNLKLTSPEGTPLVDVVDNYVRQRDASVSIKSRPGRWRLHGASQQLLPEWVLSIIQRSIPSLNSNEIDLLDISVIAPGRVRVSGAWVDDARAVIADQNKVYLLSRKRGVAIGLAGAGEQTTLFLAGDPNFSLFDHLLPRDYW